MHICILTPAYPEKGRVYHGVFVRYDAQGLAERGFDVEVIAPRYPDDPSTREDGRVKVHRFKWWAPRTFKPLVYMKKRDLWRLPSFLLGMLRKTVEVAKGSDVLLAYWIVPSGFVATLAKLRRHKPVAVFGMGSDVYHLSAHRIYKHLVRYTLTHSDLCLLNYPYMREILHQRGFKAKFQVIPASVDAELFYPKKSPLKNREDLKGKFVILYVGNLSEEKGVPQILEAFRRFSSRHPEARLVLVGRGPLAKHASSIPGVILEGAVEHHRIPDYMNAADVVYSGLGGVATLESMACARPTIVLGYPYLKHILRDGETCILVKVGDVNGLVDALERLYTDENLRKRLGNAARKAALSYSVDQRLTELSSALRSLAQAARQE